MGPVLWLQQMMSHEVRQQGENSEEGRSGGEVWYTL